MNKTDREHFIKEQQAKSAGVPAAPTEGPPFTQAEYEAYQRAGVPLYKQHPEIMNRGNQLAEAGYDFHKEVGIRIIKEARPDVLAYLQSDRGQADRCALKNAMDSTDSKAKSLAEYERIKGVVERNGLFQQPVFLPDEMGEYLADREQEFRNGTRRRR